MKRLHIHMLAPFGMRPKGTLAVRMLPLAQALTRRGHRVRIIAPPVHNPQESGTCVEYEQVPVVHTPHITLPGAAGVVQQVVMLFQEALAGQPDVVHLFKPKGYSGLAALVVSLIAPHIKLVVDTDDWEGWGGWNDLLPYPYAAKMLFAWQERDLPRRACAVTVASRTLETQMWGFGVRPQRVFYLPNGVLPPPMLTKQSCTHSPSPTLLLYTRFWEFDVRDIVVTLAVIVQRCSHVRLLVVGKGERGEEDALLHLAQRAGVATAIDYRGWVEPETIPLLFEQADVALVPMDDTLINRARCSVKLLEMMAAGLPIVAGQVGEVGEYIQHGVSGFLVPPSNAVAMAQAALHLLNDTPLRLRLGKAANERAAQHFNWERLAKQAECAYDV